VSFETDAAHVTIRMYNVGFGDAFLLAFPSSAGSKRVLIDCGVHASSPRPTPMREIVAHILESVTDGDGTPRIDLVVGTHRHRDHVSGFDDERWGAVEVGEVWMPWTEHPTDQKAKEIREAQSSAAKRLHFALPKLGATAELVELAGNALTNDEAMATLHEGFAGRPERRFRSAEEPEPVEPPVLPGVRVHVLGPVRDPEVIRDMDPPTGEGYFRLEEGEVDEDAAPAPFGPDWALLPAQLAEPALNHLELSKQDRKRLDELEQLTQFGLVVALEKAVNGTSLVLAFEVGDAVLLFPGDAQWGTWNWMLEDEGARKLLERTCFYKVGHHGSHNATPKDFVEDTLGARRAAPGVPRDDLRAMVSTHQLKMWEFIPKAELLTALRDLSHLVVRSDESATPVDGFTYQDDLFVETRIPV
jgi:beta-lactamase superfamily II metal-dependent hydrolase